MLSLVFYQKIFQIHASGVASDWLISSQAPPSKHRFEMLVEMENLYKNLVMKRKQKMNLFSLRKQKFVIVDGLTNKNFLKSNCLLM